MTRRTRGWAVLAGAALLAVAGCGTDPAQVTCRDFLRMDEEASRTVLLDLSDTLEAPEVLGIVGLLDVQYKCGLDQDQVLADVILASVGRPTSTPTPEPTVAAATPVESVAPLDDGRTTTTLEVALTLGDLTTSGQVRLAPGTAASTEPSRTHPDLVWWTAPAVIGEALLTTPSDDVPSAPDGEEFGVRVRAFWRVPAELCLLGPELADKTNAPAMAPTGIPAGKGEVLCPLADVSEGDAWGDPDLALSLDTTRLTLEVTPSVGRQLSARTMQDPVAWVVQVPGAGNAKSRSWTYGAGTLTMTDVVLAQGMPKS